MGIIEVQKMSSSVNNSIPTNNNFTQVSGVVTGLIYPIQLVLFATNEIAIRRNIVCDHSTDFKKIFPVESKMIERFIIRNHSFYPIFEKIHSFHRISKNVYRAFVILLLYR